MRRLGSMLFGGSVVLGLLLLMSQLVSAKFVEGKVYPPIDYGPLISEREAAIKSRPVIKDEKPKPEKPEEIKVPNRTTDNSVTEPLELVRLPNTIASTVPNSTDVTLDLDGIPSAGTHNGLSFASRVTPIYPTDARIKGLEGYVIVEFTVNHQGQVIEASVVDSKPKGIFDSAALRAVYKWRFKGDEQELSAQAGTQSVTLNFDLES